MCVCIQQLYSIYSIKLSYIFICILLARKCTFVPTSHLLECDTAMSGYEKHTRAPLQVTQMKTLTGPDLNKRETFVSWLACCWEATTQAGVCLLHICVDWFTLIYYLVQSARWKSWPTVPVTRPAYLTTTSVWLPTVDQVSRGPQANNPEGICYMVLHEMREITLG